MIESMGRATAVRMICQALDSYQRSMAAAHVDDPAERFEVYVRSVERALPRLHAAAETMIQEHAVPTETEAKAQLEAFFSAAIQIATGALGLLEELPDVPEVCSFAVVGGRGGSN